MSSPSTADMNFELAKNEFLTSLDQPSNYDFSSFITINDVYKETEKIQVEKAKKGELRNMRKIKPYLDRINEFSGIVETLVQVKPEILAFIWAPIKLLLQIASTSVESYDKVLEAMSQIGQALPHFQSYGTLFKENSRIQEVLVIFYKDILDFHLHVLNFFSTKGWRAFFETLWSKCGKRIGLTLDNIIRHRRLMEREVSLASIEEAHKLRIEVYAQFKRQEVADEHQQFELARQSLAPRLYDKDLERILDKCCKGTGSWIFSEPLFREWLETSNQTIRFLRLIGMPGGGKTYSSSIIIRHLQVAKHKVIFAFFQYTDSNSITRLGMLHSFIFQILLDNKELRPILHKEYESNFRQISSSVEYCCLLVERLLGDMAPIFMVVDGLDEIDPSEQRSFAECLMRIFKNCANLHLLLASRDEATISKAMRQHTEIKSIQIDTKNSDDIMLYVRSTGGQWIRDLPFEPSIILELESKLDSVAVKAQGMFLYARLVVCNLKEQGSLGDIRQEFDNLPNGLTEVYGRIVDRINRSISDKERDRVRRIFQWLGYSRLLLRKEEISCAITICPGDKAWFPERRGFKDFSELCGPIIEDRDDHVAFAHFTFKEFIFGSQSDYFLKESDAHWMIAIACMSYLTFDKVVAAGADFNLPNNVLDGDFVLQSYAESQWFEHLKRISLEPSDITSMSQFWDTLDYFIETLRNLSAEACPLVSRSLPHCLRIFLAERPEIITILEQVATFRAWQIDYAQTTAFRKSLKFDPFLISIHSSSIRNQIDAFLCTSEAHKNGCSCLIIKSKYGEKPYKCNRPACKFFHVGFKSYKAKESHIQSHERPFKCVITSCDFATIGFISESSLETHSSLHKLNTNEVSASYAIDEGSPEMIKEMLHDAIKTGELEYVKSLLAKAKLDLLLSRELLDFAVTCKSTSIITLLLSLGYDINTLVNSNFTLLSQAAYKNNEDMVKFLLRLGANVDEDTFDFFTHRNDETSSVIMKLLLERESDSINEYKKLNRIVDNHIINRIIKGKIKDDIELENREIEDVACLQVLFEKTRKSFDPQILLVSLGSGTRFSIRIAKFLLENGASVNGTDKSKNTALSMCCSKPTLAAAEFAKFLLSVGADPFWKPKRREPRGLGLSKLAQAMPKLLGVTWEEFIESCRHKRRPGGAEAEGSGLTQADKSDNSLDAGYNSGTDGKPQLETDGIVTMEDIAELGFDGDQSPLTTHRGEDEEAQLDTLGSLRRHEYFQEYKPIFEF